MAADKLVLRSTKFSIGYQILARTFSIDLISATTDGRLDARAGSPFRRFLLSSWIDRIASALRFHPLQKYYAKY